MIHPDQPDSPELKKLSEWRSKFETFSFIKNPFEDWSYEEKKVFWDHCGRLNNFYVTVGNVLNEASPSLVKEGPTMREEYGRDRMSERIKNGEDSEIYANNSSAHFHRAIRDALVSRKIDLNVLQTILNENKTSRQIMLRDPERFEKENMLKKKVESMSRFYLEILPAVFDLLEKGYTETELAR